MKKSVLLVLIVMLLLGITGSQAYAAQEINLYLDDEKLSFDSPPVIYQGRTMVPVRKLVESMGGDVGWNPQNKTVTVVKDEVTVILVIDSKIAKVNEKDVVLDVPSMIIKGRTMIPARFVSERLGAEVVWDSNARAVRVKAPVTIDDEALTLLVKAIEGSRDIKKAKLDMKGSFSITGTSTEIPENMKFDLIGTFKMDLEEPAFSFAGKVTLRQGVISQDLNLEMVMKDNVMYLKDPLTGKWSATEIPEEDAGALKIALDQSANTSIDYKSLVDIARETGVFRNVSFAGTKTLNAKNLTGVYVELNGLKIGGFIQKALSNGEAAPLFEEEFQEVWSQVSVGKVKFTYWIDTRTNMVYGTESEMRMTIRIPEGEGLGDISFEFDSEANYSDINKEQNIKAPAVSEAINTALPFSL